MPWVKQNDCTGCSICFKECPVDAIYWWNAKAKIDRNNCLQCGTCQEICQQGAIRDDSEPEVEEEEIKYNWPF